MGNGVCVCGHVGVNLRYVSQSVPLVNGVRQRKKNRLKLLGKIGPTITDRLILGSSIDRTTVHGASFSTHTDTHAHSVWQNYVFQWA